MSIELIPTDTKISHADLVAKVNELITALNAASAPRDRGPKSEKTMTDEDARAVICGELKDVSHKMAAEKLGLSYGQIYSARKGFTFKTIHAEIRNAK